jgi:hypothetical protein
VFRFRLFALATVVAAASALTILGSSAAHTTATSFSITHYDLPLFVKQNGPKGTRSVSWQGNPTFPVTLHERGICPESVNCGPRGADGFGTPTYTLTFPTHADPLVTKSFYFCSGSLTSNYVIGVEGWLTDARGHRTPIVRNFWVCKTH